MKIKCIYLVFLLLITTGCSSYKYQEVTPVQVTQVGPANTQVVTPPVIRNPYLAKSSLEWVTDLTNKANCLINNEDFLREVEAFPAFTHTTATPKQVADSLRSMSTFNVSTYRARIGSSVIATTYSTDRTTLYLNLRKNPRTMQGMVNTVLHESLHLSGYSHGSNSPVGKQDSVNYRVGSIAEKYTELCK